MKPETDPGTSPAYELKQSLAIWKDRVDQGHLKRAINNFIWEQAHPHLTLDKAEDIAVALYEQLSRDPDKEKA